MHCYHEISNSFQIEEERWLEISMLMARMVCYATNVESIKKMSEVSMKDFEGCELEVGTSVQHDRKS